MIIQAICKSYKREILQGIHSSGHTYKMALYTSAASLDADTAFYTAIHEAAGTGYASGGTILTGFTITTVDEKVFLSFNSATWDPSSLTARGALVYNFSAATRAVAVLDFGADQTSLAGPFIVDLSNKLLAFGPPRRRIGDNSPEGSVRAEPGTTYWDKLNKAAWVKETSTDEFGWYLQFGPVE